MEENKMEMMEMETEMVDTPDFEGTEDSGSGNGLKLVLAGLAGAAAIGTVAYKKIKAKKSDKPKKKWKLMRVEVPAEETTEDLFEPDAEIVDEAEEK